jgi:hypothetical protein
MTSRRKIVEGVAGILLVLGALGVALEGRPGAAEGAARSRQVREVFFGESEATVCQAGAREFSLNDLRELHVCVVFWGLTGTHSAQLTFVSPDGNVYQKVTLAFVTPEAPATVATVEVEGRHHEVRRAGWRQRGETLVVATLPVAGTYITQYRLAGLWTVKVSLDGKPVDEDYVILHLPQPRHPRK